MTDWTKIAEYLAGLDTAAQPCLPVRGPPQPDGTLRFKRLPFPPFQQKGR